MQMINKLIDSIKNNEQSRSNILKSQGTYVSKRFQI